MHDLIMKIEAWKKADKKTKAELHKPRGSYATYRHHWPFAIYNGMINPIIPFEIKGVLWYQGESNVERAYQYRQLFPALINDWRGRWNQPDMPFLFVQLANFHQHPAKPCI